MSGRIWAVHSASRSRHKMNKALLKLNSMTFMIWQSLTNMQKTATIAWRMGCRSPPRPKSLWKNTLNLSVVFLATNSQNAGLGNNSGVFLGTSTPVSNKDVFTQFSASFQPFIVLQLPSTRASKRNFKKYHGWSATTAAMCSVLQQSQGGFERNLQLSAR